MTNVSSEHKVSKLGCDVRGVPISYLNADAIEGLERALATQIGFPSSFAETIFRYDAPAVSFFIITLRSVLLRFTHKGQSPGLHDSE